MEVGSSLVVVSVPAPRRAPADSLGMMGPRPVTAMSNAVLVVVLVDAPAVTVPWS